MGGARSVQESKCCLLKGLTKHKFAVFFEVLEALYRLQWTSTDGLGVLIISPTRELAYQTFEVLRKVGKNHDFSAGLIIGGKVCLLSCPFFYNLHWSTVAVDRKEVEISFKQVGWHPGGVTVI